MTNLDSVLKGRNISLLTKVHIVKAMAFSVMYGCESWIIKKTEHWRTDASELWCWRRLLRVPWTARRCNQSVNPKGILNTHWKDWCWSSNTLATWCEEPTHWKRPWCWERLKAGGEGGQQRMRWFDGIIDKIDMSWSKLRETAKDREAWHSADHRVAKSRTQLSDWTPQLLHCSLCLLDYIHYDFLFPPSKGPMIFLPFPPYTLLLGVHLLPHWTWPTWTSPWLRKVSDFTPPFFPSTVLQFSMSRTFSILIPQ